ncbi:MAG: hypothetical protein V4530_01635 [Pseudomonadota bacterium]
MRIKVATPWRFRVSHIAAIGLTAVTIAPITDGFAAVSKPVAAASPVETWSYADVSDLFLASPVVARVRVVEAIRLPEAPGVATPGTRIRYYLVGDVTSLIRGTGGLAPRVAWLADVAPDARGKPPKLIKTIVMLAALPVDGKPGELRLTARDAMVPWSAAAEERVRTVIANGLATDAPPRITGITSAFHSPGNLPGEGETQIFLATASSEPVSLSILRRPGMEPRWAVALGEIVDEAAKPPARDTLAWYRLACTLPADLPNAATAELSSEGVEAARTDYKFVISALGPCTRTRSQS